MFRDHRTAGAWLPKTMYTTRFQESGYHALAEFDERRRSDDRHRPSGVTIAGENLSTWNENAVPFRGRGQRHAEPQRRVDRLEQPSWRAVEQGRRRATPTEARRRPRRRPRRRSRSTASLPADANAEGEAGTAGDVYDLRAGGRAIRVGHRRDERGVPLAGRHEHEAGAAARRRTIRRRKTSRQADETEEAAAEGAPSRRPSRSRTPPEEEGRTGPDAGRSDGRARRTRRATSRGCRSAGSAWRAIRSTRASIAAPAATSQRFTNIYELIRRRS